MFKRITYIFAALVLAACSGTVDPESQKPDVPAGVNAEQVSILHGTGTGALKQVVRDYLAERQKSMRRLRSGDIVFHDGDPDRGGAGITVVEI